MPCTDGGVPYGPTKEELNAVKFAKRAEPLLCSACRALERLGYDFDENAELSEWWDAHKKADAARVERERVEEERKAYERKIVKDALDKKFGDLTKTEKALLKKHNFL
jgi:hypothetical protein